MPEYTYKCEKCKEIFTLITSIANYQSNPKCSCGSKSKRCYAQDCSTINSSVRKNDNELKTLGDLALRNTERMSDDQKEALRIKHNEYKEKPSTKKLPKGMTRIPKQPKIKWT
jgi:hypothetical protein